MDILELARLTMGIDMANDDNTTESSRNYSIIEDKNNSQSSFNNHQLLESFNNAVLVYQLPAIVYTAVMMILGLPGNMIVFYVYFFKWRQSTSRVFILFIAALDMVNCATTLPMEIFIMRYSVKLNRPFLCKVTRFSTFTMNSASAIILVGIAIDRFIHICRPHSRSFSAKTSMHVCIGSIVIATCLTWPSFLLYGTRHLDLGELTGFACLTQNKFDQTPYPLMFFGVIFLITMLLFIVLAVFYCLIGARIYKHRKFKERKCTHQQRLNDEEEVAIDEDSGSHYKLAKKPPADAENNKKANETVNNISLPNDVNLESENQNVKLNDITNTENHISNGSQVALEPTNNSEKVNDAKRSASVVISPLNPIEENDEDKTETDLNQDTLDKNNIAEHINSNGNESAGYSKAGPKRLVSKSSSSSTTRSSCGSNKLTSSVRYLLVRGASTIRRSERDKCTKCVTVRIGRSTLMLFLITLAYILSFVPFYIIVIIRQSDETFVLRLSKGELMAYHLFLRSYLLSSAINPFIYSFCNAQFREYCRDLFLHVILRRPQSRTMSKLQRRY